MLRARRASRRLWPLGALLWTILALLLVSGLLLAIEELVKRGRPDNTSPISPTVTLVITVFGLVASSPLPINKTMDFLNDAFLIGYDNVSPACPPAPPPARPAARPPPSPPRCAAHPPAHPQSRTFRR